MQIEDAGLNGLKLITPRRFGDDRGFFAETWNARDFHAAGIDLDFVQDNHSLSQATATVRGLHFQAPPHDQAKLVRCGRGRIFDVAVDIRRNSPTYGQWAGFELSFENALQLLVPSGFAHGFMTLEPGSEIVYKCSALYAPKSEGVLRWNDPELGINWPDTGVAPTLAARDAGAPGLADLNSPFQWQDQP